MLVNRCFRKARIGNRLVVVSDGERAIRYCGGDGPYGNRELYPLPGLVLLDLGLPGLSGFQVLSWLRSQEKLRHLPVVVLTASVFSADVKRAYQMGANSFLVKPVELSELAGAIKEMLEFWLGPCELPTAMET